MKGLTAEEPALRLGCFRDGQAPVCGAQSWLRFHVQQLSVEGRQSSGGIRCQHDRALHSHHRHQPRRTGWL